MKDYIPTKEEKKVIDIIKAEKQEYQQGKVWVTKDVSYEMRDIVQKSRKNYLGKFDEERDEVTDRKKHFVPLTEDMVETVVKNIDLDSVDVNIRATNPQGYTSANILRYLINNYLRQDLFGELLNEAIRLFAIDGTLVFKIYDEYNEKKDKREIKTKTVDRTNIIIDPSADNMQDVPVIERNVLKMSELRDYPWDNTEYVKGRKNIEKLNWFEGRNTRTEVPYVEVYERWGELPIGEDGEWVPALAIVSNVDTDPVVHVIRETEKEYKPYEEVRFRKVYGRWDGRGIGEVVKPLQSYINETVNLRINAARISQMGLFKYRKGSGITKQMLKSLVSGGALPVTRMDDIDTLNTPEVKQSSYADEEKIYNWTQRVTGAWNVSRGENLPASQPATTAVLQQEGASSGFSLLEENFGMFLSRVFERHIIPMMIDNLDAEEVVNIVGSPKELSKIDESYMAHKNNKFIINYLAENGKSEGDIFPDVGFLEQRKRIMKQGLKKLGKNRPIKVIRKMLKKYEYNTDVFITGESFNKSVVVRQLNDLLANYSKLPGVNIDTDAVFKEILNQMGLGGERFMQSAQETQGNVPLQNLANIAKRGSTGQPGTNQRTEMAGEENTLERSGRGGIR